MATYPSRLKPLEHEHRLRRGRSQLGSHHHRAHGKQPAPGLLQRSHRKLRDTHVVVDSSTTPGVPVTMTTYQSESDITLYPIPITAPIEGSRRCPTTGDNHPIVIDKTQCWIYETWQTQLCNGAWSAANRAIWDLTSTEHRPNGWTSADAAACPSFPGWYATTK